MRVWPIFKKELRVYFTSPVAYGVFTFFLLISGYFFASIFAFFNLVSMQSAMNPALARDLNVTEGIMRPLFSNIGVVMLFMMPILTMRLFAEEKKTGTIELLLTYPVRDGEVLLGKYVAAGTLYLMMLAATALYPGILAYFARIEWGPLLTGYLGLTLMGAAFLAVGVLASSLTENQIVAAIATFGALLIFWVIGWSADFAGPVWGKILAHLSILEHFDSFAKGVIDTKDVIYYLNFTILSLFLTLRSLESKRWRG
jgi:ABC-2 type transport system permease protein